jgi:membrane protein implicated in regulation of membrane protease activity
METIDISYLLAIGILLIGLEVLTFSLVLFFLGLGFILMALVSSFVVFDNGYVQVALAFSIALVSAFGLRKSLLKRLIKTPTPKEEKTHKSGIGYVEDGAVKFDGTYWKTLDDLSNYNNGDKVEVIDVQDNMVVLK